MCQYVCFSVCLSIVVLCQSKCTVKMFCRTQTLMLPTLLNSPGIRKHFNSPLHFKPSALEIITTYRISKSPGRPPRRPARPPARPLARPTIHPICARPPDRTRARPPAHPTVNQTKQYLLDWPPAHRLHAKQHMSTIHNYYIQSIIVRL